MSTPAAGHTLRLRGQECGQHAPLVMAIINRTTDSFFPGARQLDDTVAQKAVAQAVAEGADIVDIGGIKAAPGEVITAQEEIDRVIGFAEWVHTEFPQVYLSVDTWRAEVGQVACAVGADILNDTWAGHDPDLVQVAADHQVAVVCSHTGGALPRTRPHRVAYGDSPDDIVAEVVTALSKAATRAVSLGVHPGAVLIDPTHDFGKNTWHGLTLLRHTERLVGLGFPVLMALSRKDFVGETLDLPVTERLHGTLAATSVAAWLGAKVIRAHDVLATRHTVDMVASLRGERPPAAVVRGLA